MLQLKQIDLRRGTKLLFENAGLQAHAGQRVGIIGINGSVKSSLLASWRAMRVKCSLIPGM